MVTNIEIPWFYWPIYEEDKEKDFLSSLIGNKIRRNFNKPINIKKYSRSSLKNTDIHELIKEKKPLFIIHYWWSYFLRAEEKAIEETTYLIEKIRNTENNSRTPILITHYGEETNYFRKNFFQPISFVDIYNSEEIVKDLEDVIIKTIL